MSYNSVILNHDGHGMIWKTGKILILGPTRDQTPDPPEAESAAPIMMNYVKSWSGWGTVLQPSPGVRDLDRGYLLKFCTWCVSFA